MKYIIDIVVGVTPPTEDIHQALKIGDRVEIGGSLLGSKTTIKIATDSRMKRVAGELANMVNLIGHAR